MARSSDAARRDAAGELQMARRQYITWVSSSGSPHLIFTVGPGIGSVFVLLDQCWNFTPERCCISCQISQPKAAEFLHFQRQRWLHSTQTNHKNMRGRSLEVSTLTFEIMWVCLMLFAVLNSIEAFEDHGEFIRQPFGLFFVLRWNSAALAAQEAWNLTATKCACQGHRCPSDIKQHPFLLDDLKFCTWSCDIDIDNVYHLSKKVWFLLVAIAYLIIFDESVCTQIAAVTFTQTRRQLIA